MGLVRSLRRSAAKRIRRGRGPFLKPTIDSARSTALATFKSLSELDPELASTLSAEAIEKLNVEDGFARLPYFGCWRRLFEALEHPYDHLVFVPWLKKNTIDLMAYRALKDVIEGGSAESVLFVITDHHRCDGERWLPENVKALVFDDFSTSDRKLKLDDRGELVVLLVRALLPESILNVNSLACWEAIKLKGAALSQITEIHAGLFSCNTEKRTSARFSETDFRSCLPYLTKLYFDNNCFRRQSIE